MYEVLKGTHNILRWLVVLGALAALVTAYWGMFARRPWSGKDRASGIFYTAMLGLQLILGLVLYVISPYGWQAITSIAAGNSDWQLYFFGIFHILAMILAFVAAQVGYSTARRAPGHAIAFRRATIGYSLSFLLMFLAIPWGFRPNWPMYLFG